ncbi:MAG TPA: N-acyl homoserine lactonase family protein [Allosphingosinicella sp.]|nr:N-acyl homoserine lactonase family protein [Allosphingosinicella sp.]
MSPRPDYEVLALRYAENPAQRAAQNFLGGDDHDGPMPLDYFVWLIRGGGRAFVVDTGFDAAMARKRGRIHLARPDDLLAAVGVRQEQVRDVIVTHLHYDHCGNHDLFPAARFHLQDREMAYATGRCMCHAPLRQPLEAEDVVAMVRRVFDGRVAFHDGMAMLAPGIELHRIGGHTDGLQIVRVWTRRGWLVLASDASHFYANMEQRRPFPLVYNVGDMLEGYRTCYALASAPENVIPGHDPLVTRRYPVAGPGLEGKAVRLDADPA